MILGGPESEPFAKTDSATRRPKYTGFYGSRGGISERHHIFAEAFDELVLKESQKPGVVDWIRCPSSLSATKRLGIDQLISLLNMNNFED